MLLDVVIAKNEEFLNQLRSIHSDSISSNGKLFDNTDPENPVAIIIESDEKSALFESIESNIKRVEAAAYKKIEFQKGDYEYVKPSERPMAPVTSADIKSKLARLKRDVEVFSEKLKKENYRLIDGQKNESHTFSPVEKGLFKKINTGIEQLVELY